MDLGEIDAKEVIRHYVANTHHGRKSLAKKSIVGLSPQSIFAMSLWVTHRWAEGRLPNGAATGS